MITRGPFAPTVTQHKASDGTPDAMGDTPKTFADVKVNAYAAFPGNALEQDTAAADQVWADLVLILSPATIVQPADEFTHAGTRYRVTGQPGRYLHPVTGTAVTQVNLRRISTV